MKARKILFFLLFLILIINIPLISKTNKIIIARDNIKEIEFPLFYRDQYELTYNCFSRIVSLGTSNNIIADLAYRWEIDKQHKNYIFYIRNNVFFHNGSKLSLQDIKNSLEYNIKNAHNIISPGIKTIVGFKEFIEGKKKHLTGIIVKNGKIIFILKKPVVNFLETLTDLNLSIYKKANKRYIGTGPFIPVKFYKKSNIVYKIILKKYKKYFINIKATPDLIEVVKNDYYKDIGKYDIAFFEKEKEYKRDLFYFEEIPTSTIEILFFNMRSYWGKNKNFRKFMVYSYNYRKIIDKYHLDKYNQWNIIPIGYKYYKDIPSFPKYDKSIMLRYLKRIGNKSKPVNILTVDRLHRKEMAIDIKKILIKNGFKVNIIEKNFTKFSKRLDRIVYQRTDNSTDITLAGILLSNPPFTVNNYLQSIFYRNADNNAADYNNEAIIKMLDKLKSINKESTRKNIISKIIKIYNDDVPMVPLYTRTVYLYRKKKIINFQVDFSKYIDYRDIRIK